MTHPFHTGRYSGAATVPCTRAAPAPAAALVLHHTRPIPLDSMFRGLDAHPQQRGIAGVRLVPITVIDFYAVPDVRSLGREENCAGDAASRPVHVCARPAVGVPATGAELSAVQGGGVGRRGRARQVAGQEVR